MVREFNRYFILFFVAGLLAFGSAGLDQARASAGDQSASGVVKKTGFGSFVLKTKGGNKTFNTGRGTKYEPADFRPREGDKVEVNYYDKDHRGKTIQAVSLLKLIKANPNFKEPANPAEGTVKEAGRKNILVYIPKIKKAWKFEFARGMKRIPKKWKPAADDKVRVTYKKVPSRFTGNIIYQIKTLEKM